MLNHFCTLFINLPQAKYAPLATVDLPIDATFTQEVPTLGPLDAVRRCIFGAQPDADMRLYRTIQYLAAIRSSPLQNYLSQFDTRITTLQSRTAFFYNRAVLLTVNPVGERATVNVTGSAKSCDSTGRMRQSFLASIQGGTATVYQGAATLGAYSAAGPIPLGDSGLSLQTSAPATSKEIVAEWLSPATLSLEDISQQIESLGTETYVALFGTSEDEPLSSYRRAFSTQSTVTRAAALALALVHQMEKLRVTSE